MFWRKRHPAELMSIRELLDQVSILRTEVTRLHSEVLRIDDAQSTLTGRFYRYKMHKPSPAEEIAPAPPPVPVRTSKAEVLRAHFTPGQAPRHIE